jgi:olefin beta-lactone synthetase
MPQWYNIADSLAQAARERPSQVAVAEPRSQRQRPPLEYRTITFGELWQRSQQVAWGLRQAGVPAGARISLMVPPGIEFVTWVFGLFHAGCTVILIDPGMGRRNMLRCLAEAEPEGLVGIGLAQVIRRAAQNRWPQCRWNFTVGTRWLGCGQKTAVFFQRPIPDAGPLAVPPSSTSADAEAAIIFTTGSTGPPKGVLYRHRHFIAQTEMIRDYFHVQPGGADVSGFPLFALFNTGMGMTTVFPRMDATRPAQIVPEDFLDAVRHFSANQSFGSPALWNTVSRYCERHGVQAPTLQRVITAGAPVPAHVLARVRSLLPEHGQVFTPYGATEALPVACIESRVVLQETAAQTAVGRGTCVGHRWPGMEWRVVRISDQPAENLAELPELPCGEIGELVVQGPVVTDRYVTRVAANALHKLDSPTGLWHRMGDVGYRDEQDRFWFCGRKNQRVRTARDTLFTIPCEAILNQHSAVYRSALVGAGSPGTQVPVMFVEPWPEAWPKTAAAQRELERELLILAHSHPLTQEVARIYLRRALPVDIRHNAKIFREQLAVWATRHYRP